MNQNQYLLNRIKYLKKRYHAREMHVCNICGGKYTTSNKAVHEITNKHRDALVNHD